MMETLTELASGAPGDVGRVFATLPEDAADAPVESIAAA
jgi:hypothetical protein